MILANSKIEHLSSDFQKTGYIKFSKYFSDEVFSTLVDECNSLLEIHGKRKDFIMNETNNTPRRITTVSGELINKESTMLRNLYKDETLIHFLQQICSKKLYVTPDMNDRHAIHKLHKRNDLHGGHLDTYPYVFITCLESPGIYGGGELEFVPFSKNQDDLGTDKAIIDNLELGNSYFMSADKTIHRVLPLLKDVNRTVLVFTYADDESKDISVSYSSNKLYN